MNIHNKNAFLNTLGILGGKNDHQKGVIFTIGQNFPSSLPVMHNLVENTMLNVDDTQKVFDDLIQFDKM